MTYEPNTNMKLNIKIGTKKQFFLYSKDSRPDNNLWNEGYDVSYGFKLLCFHFLMYTKLT